MREMSKQEIRRDWICFYCENVDRWGTDHPYLHHMETSIDVDIAYYEGHYGTPEWLPTGRVERLEIPCDGCGHSTYGERWEYKVLVPVRESV